ncbi:unnamed protein product [Gongylonema pulchrum]|uniref:Uncharacterized protein n=1 Tax=Gongylonema pulchrum TaxID=637853 RepID=A0A183ERD1_9BILA|nr:unnamed protein product [Gongylonema pulchrum]
MQSTVEESAENLSLPATVGLQKNAQLDQLEPALRATDDLGEFISLAEEMEKRPPIRIKIALANVAFKNCVNKNSDKKNRVRKKRKRKHRMSDSWNEEVNGVLPSCSGVDCYRVEDASPQSGGPSRILLRITRRKNDVSVADSQNNRHVPLGEPSKGDHITFLFLYRSFFAKIAV